MSTRNNIKPFIAQDMTMSADFVYELSADYNITLQFFWTGLVGTGVVSLFYSSDGIHWDKYPLRDLEQSVVYYDLPIVGGTDSMTVKINNLGSGFIKIGYVTSASGGVLDGNMNILDNKHY